MPSTRSRSNASRATASSSTSANDRNTERGQEVVRQTMNTFTQEVRPTNTLGSYKPRQEKFIVSHEWLRSSSRERMLEVELNVNVFYRISVPKDNMLMVQPSQRKRSWCIWRTSCLAVATHPKNAQMARLVIYPSNPTQWR